MKGGNVKMNDKLKAGKVGLSLGLVFAITSLVCAILVYFMPAGMISLANNIFHGLDVSQIARSSFSWGGVIFGIVEIFIIGFIGGWLFALIYNKLK